MAVFQQPLVYRHASTSYQAVFGAYIAKKTKSKCGWCNLRQKMVIAKIGCASEEVPS
jgi:hypothetical protein